MSEALVLSLSLLGLVAVFCMAFCADAARFFGDRRYELYAAVLGAALMAAVGWGLWSLVPW